MIEDLHWADPVHPRPARLHGRADAKEQLLDRRQLPLKETTATAVTRCDRSWPSWPPTGGRSRGRGALRHRRDGRLPDGPAQLTGHRKNRPEHPRARFEGNAYFAQGLTAPAARDSSTASTRTASGRAGRRPAPSLEQLTAAAQHVVEFRVGGRAPGGQRPPRAGRRSRRRRARTALREAVTHQVLVPEDGQRYAFRHALLAEAVCTATCCPASGSACTPPTRD